MGWLNRRWGMLRPSQVELLKARIKARLATEDYTCRLPREKPRVRYKLRRSWVGIDTRVWK